MLKKSLPIAPNRHGGLKKKDISLLEKKKNPQSRCFLLHDPTMSKRKSSIWIFVVVLIVCFSTTSRASQERSFNPSKSELCLLVKLATICSNDPHCSFVYNIDEVVRDQLGKFATNLKEDEKSNIRYEMEMHHGDDNAFIADYVHNVTQEHGRYINAGSDDVVVSFGSLVKDVEMVAEYQTFAKLKSWSTLQFYNNILTELEANTITSNQNNTREMEMFCLITMLKLKVMDSRGFSCADSSQIPTFIEEENKVVCLEFNLRGAQYKEKAKRVSTSSTPSCESSEVDMIIVLLIIIFIGVLVVIGMLTWIFIKI